MITTFCDGCSKEIDPKNQYKISLKIGYAPNNEIEMKWSSIRRGYLDLCSDCVNLKDSIDIWKAFERYKSTEST